MAREHRRPEDFEAIASSLSSGIDSLNSIAQLMRDGELPSALVHGQTVENKYVPAVLDWIEKTLTDVKIQLRAKAAGKTPEVERRKQYNENQKLAAAKKATKKKM